MKSFFCILVIGLIGVFASADSSSWEPLRSLVETGTSNANRSFGEKDLLVVRIEAKDSSTTATEEELIGDIFDDEITFTKQMNSCSHGKLTINPATGKNINNGVTTIKLNHVVGRSTDSIIEAIDADSISLFGKALNEFDHVMFCMPPGMIFVNSNSEATKSWQAYVPGHWRYTNFVTVFNDEWCSSISAGMHEIGHNLGLEHSNESGSTYKDETGSMGYSSMKDTFGAMRCYNPSKSWQLGWYSEHSRRIDPFIDAPFQTIITGITRPPLDGDPYRNILVQIPNGQTDFYIGYNLAEEYNSGTIEGRNKVLINEKEPGLRSFSNLLAKMRRGDLYKINNYQGSGENLFIKVDANFGNSKEALLNVYFENNNISKIAGCNNNQVRFEVTVKTDAYADDTSWNLIDNETKAVVASRSNREFHNNVSHNDLICIDRKRDFTFTIYDEYEDGICCTQGWGAYSLFLDGKEIFHGGEFKSSSVSHTFRTKEVEQTISCHDDPFFRYKRLRKCSWAAHDKPNRCKKMWTGKPIEQHCPTSCGVCDANLQVDSSTSKSSRNIGNNIFCQDDQTFLIRGEHSCEWIAEDTARCNKKWNGTYIREHCKATCNFC